MLNRLFIFGGESTAIEIAEAAEFMYKGIQIHFVIGDSESATGEKMLRESDLSAFLKVVPVDEHQFIISMENLKIRYACQALAEELGMLPVTIQHPGSMVSSSATIGKGSYLAHGVVVSSQANLGEHSILNFNAVFGHDSVAAEHLMMCPGAVIAGNVKLAERAFIGANSFIKQGLSIGRDVQIDAMTYIFKNIEDSKLCVNRNLDILNRSPLY